jgi:hypothetical protein
MMTIPNKTPPGIRPWVEALVIAGATVAGIAVVNASLGVTSAMSWIAVILVVLAGGLVYRWRHRSLWRSAIGRYR